MEEEYDALYNQDGPDVIPPVSKSSNEKTYHKMRGNNNTQSKWKNDVDLYETTVKPISAIYDYVKKIFLIQMD